MLLTFNNTGVKLLESPWPNVPQWFLDLIMEKVEIEPEGFDVPLPRALLDEVVNFLNHKKLFWYRVTHITMDEQCIAVYTSYDALQRREAER